MCSILNMSNRKESQHVRYVLDDFEIYDKIADGAFGDIHMVKNVDSNQYQVLKKLFVDDGLVKKQMDEMNILAQLSHPFVIKYHGWFRDSKITYMVLEYINSENMLTYLRKCDTFSNKITKFYAAQAVLAISYIHSMGVIYRDLQPENILFDKQGYIKIIDFGYSKQTKEITWTLCGTPEYLAPEIIKSIGHGLSVDWWALGIMIYEMLVGYPPFVDENPFCIYQQVLSHKISIPEHMHEDASDIIMKFLIRDRNKRLGSVQNGVPNIKKHKWFRGIDFTALYNKSIPAPSVDQLRQTAKNNKKSTNNI